MLFRSAPTPGPSGLVDSASDAGSATPAVTLHLRGGDLPGYDDVSSPHPSTDALFEEADESTPRPSPGKEEIESKEQAPVFLKDIFLATSEFIEAQSTATGGVEEAHTVHLPRTVPRSNLFMDEASLNGEARERVLGRLEGILIGQWIGHAGLDTQNAYAQVGVQYPDSLIEAAKRAGHGSVTASPGVAIQPEAVDGQGRSTNAMTPSTSILPFVKNDQAN